MRFMTPKFTLPIVLLAALALPCAAQPPFDSSGDALLNGPYYLRQVFYFVEDEEGDIEEAMNVQGTITFNPGGTYNFSGSILDSSVGTPQTYTSSGTYTISASGLGYISSPNPNFPTDQILGLVSHGIFIGSSTENPNGYNDLFIAAPVGSVATNATLNGSYTVAYMDPTYSSSQGPGGDALFSMSADGQGHIGNVNVTEYLGATNSPTTGTLSGVTYAFSNGAAQINFGGNSNGTALIEGTELLYISPDGNFIFGGNYNGFDMFVGVRGATSNPTSYDGLYYQAGVDLNDAPINSGYTLLDSYYGSLNAFSTNIIGHQRLNSLLLYDGSSDFTYYDSYTLNGNGSSDDSFFSQHYVSSPDGSIRIGYGIGPFLGLNVALMAPSLSGSGVYLSPVGIVNAASSAPFTSFLSPGEFITLYGTGLSSGDATASSLPLPITLNNVQVMINERPAPIFYVSPTQISVIVPYLTESVAEIQVINNQVNSNIVTQFVGQTSLGVFTENPVGGIGYAAALHPDYSVISESSPAQIGETVAVYLAGGGEVSPTVNDGEGAPSNPLSQTGYTPLVYLLDSAGDYVQATSVTFSGLAPGFAGLYQIDFTIPSGLAAGDADLEILGTDSDTLECLLPIGSGTTANTEARAKSAAGNRPAGRHLLPPRRLRVNATPR